MRFDIRSSNANMPNRKSHKSKKSRLRSESPQLDRTEVQDPLKQTIKSSKPGPSREALVDCSEVSLIGDVQHPEHVDQGQEQVSEIVRNSLQNHDRMDSGRRYCLLTTIHEVTCRGHRALSKPMWNPAGIANMMSDDLDVTEAVVLDHITAILYGG